MEANYFMGGKLVMARSLNKVMLIGHDRFTPDLIEYALGEFIKSLGISLKEFMAYGRVHPDYEQEPFCMTVLALKLTRNANAVSELYGKVSR